MTERSKRKYFTREQKKELLLEIKKSGITHAEFARRKGIHPVTIYQWKREMRNIQSTDDHNIDEILLEIDKLKKENKQLKEVVGELSIDKKILETAVDVYKKSQLKRKFKSSKKSCKK